MIRLKNTKSRLLAAGISFFALLILVLLYPKIKSWRAEQLYQEGIKELSSNQDTNAAIELLYASHQLAPERKETIIELAKLLRKEDIGKSLLFWQLLTERFPDDLSYWENILQIALAQRKQSLATETFSMIEERFPGELQNTELYRVQLLILNEQYDEAIALLDETNLDNFTWQQLSGLWKILLPHNEELTQKSLFFNRQLDNNQLSPAQIDEIIAISNQHGWLIPPDRLQDIFKSKGAESKLLKKKITSYGLRHFPKESYWVNQASNLFPINSIQDKIDYAVWFRRSRRAELARVLWTEEETFARRDVFLVYLDILAELDDWKDIRRLVQKQDAPLEEFLKFAFLARAERELQLTGRFDLTWKKAIRATRNKAESLVFLNEFAKRYEYTAAQLAVIERLKTSPALTEIAFREQIQLFQKTAQTKLLKVTLEEMIVLFPNNPSIINDLAYISLLLSPELAQQLIAEVERLAKENSNILAYRITLALAYLHKGEWQKAGHLIEVKDLDWSTVRPSWRAIKAITLHQNGKINEAKILQKSIPTKSLLPEEESLLLDFLSEQ